MNTHSIPSRSASGTQLLSSQSYRLDNGATQGPRRQKWGAEKSTRATQGAVNVNALVYRELYNSRVRNTKAVPQTQRLGSATSTDDLDVHQHELVFTFKRPSVRRGRGGGAITAFSSFNGIATSQYANQDAFEDSFVLVGRAKVPYFFNSPEQGNHGVSVQVRGAQSIANRGESEFFPGDLIRWHLPALDDAERREQIKNAHSPEGYPKEKLTALVSRLSYADLYKMPQRAFARYMQVRASSGGEQLVQTRQIGTRATASPDRLTRFAIGYMRAGGMMKLLAGVAVLQEMGLVTLNVPSEWQNRARYTQALSSLPRSLDEATQRSGAQERRERADKLITLAYMLDLATPRARDAYLAPASALIDETLRTQFRGLLESRAERERYSLARLLDSSSSAGVEDARQSPVYQLERMQVNAVRREVELFAECKKREDEKVVGKAISHSLPGEMQDVLM